MATCFSFTSIIGEGSAKGADRAIHLEDSAFVGFDASEKALNTAEVFNPADGTFVATDNTMTDPRGFHTAILLLSGKVTS